jgi:cytochrome c
MNSFRAVLLISFGTMIFISPASSADGDASRGQRLFGACAACHSLEPNRNMTSPSLSNLWNRKAGSLSSFPRYSPALKSTDIVWDDKTLGEWLKDPQHFVPGNTMTFPGITNAQQRADLLAFLRDATRPGRTPPASAQRSDQMGGMMGMGGGGVPNLKQLDAEDRVQAINHCGDTYKVTTADGNSRDFWERNLRFKTDVIDEGPQKGAPALVRAGMMGDRADVIFAAPGEISGFIADRC